MQKHTHANLPVEKPLSNSRPFIVVNDSVGGINKQLVTTTLRVVKPQAPTIEQEKDEIASQRIDTKAPVASVILCTKAYKKALEILSIQSSGSLFSQRSVNVVSALGRDRKMRRNNKNSAGDEETRRNFVTRIRRVSSR